MSKINDVAEQVVALAVDSCVVSHHGRMAENRKLDPDFLASVKARGVLSPIVVRRVNGSQPGTVCGEQMYEIAFGRKRWRAAKELGLATVPAIVREYSDAEMAEIELIENLQRKDLNPLEEALGLKRLRDEFGVKVKELMARVNKSRSHVYDSLALADKLGKECRAALAEGKIDRSVAVALSRVPAALQAAKLVDVEDMSFRDAVREIDDDAKRLQKNDAAFHKAAAAAKEKGQRVLTPAEAGKVFHPWGGVMERSAFVGPRHWCDAGRAYYADLVKGLDVPVVIAQGNDGAVVELYDKAATLKALKEAGKLKAESKSSSGGGYDEKKWKEQQRKREATEKLKEKIHNYIGGRLVTRIELAKDVRPVLRLVMQPLGTWDACVKRRKLGASDAALEKSITKMTLTELVGLMVEKATQGGYDGFNRGEGQGIGMKACEMFGLDVKALTKEAKAAVVGKAEGKTTETLRQARDDRQGKGKSKRGKKAKAKKTARKKGGKR